MSDVLLEDLTGADAAAIGALAIANGAAADSAVVHKTGAETIAGAKTLSDRLTINRSGGVTFPAYMSDAGLQVVGPANSVIRVHTDTFGAQGGGFYVRRANGTPTTPTAVLNHHVFGLFGGCGHDGTAWGDSAASYMSSSPGQDWSPGNHGAQLNFVVTPNGTTTPVTVLSVYEGGNLTVRGDNLWDQNSAAERTRVAYFHTLDLTTAMRFGSTSSYAALMPNGSQIKVRLADDSDYGNLIAGVISATSRFALPSYTVATVPAAAAGAGGLIYVSNEAGGGVPAYSDNVNWRRVTDRAIIS